MVVESFAIVTNYRIWIKFWVTYTFLIL